MNTYVKIPMDSDYEILVQFQNLTFRTKKNHICGIIDIQGDEWTVLMSNDGTEIDIEKLKCSSLEELLVELELKGCLYHVGIDSGPNVSIDVKKLKAENFKLKKQLKSIGRLLTQP